MGSAGLLGVLLLLGGEGVDQVAELKECRELLRSRHLSERGQALLRLGKLLELPGEEVSPNVTRTLASALHDESFEMRREAASKIATSPHQKEAVGALVEALEEIQKDWSKRGRGRGREPLARDALAYAEVVVKGLGQLPDDRSVKSLTTLLSRFPPGAPRGMVSVVAGSLVELGAREGIKSVIERLSQAAAAAGRQAGRGGDDQNRRRSGERGGEALHRLLAKAAEERGLEGIPEWSDKAHAEWRHWFSKNQGRFPAKLGRIEPIRPAESDDSGDDRKAN